MAAKNLATFARNGSRFAECSSTAHGSLPRTRKAGAAPSACRNARTAATFRRGSTTSPKKSRSTV
eukprot:6985768-Lingulodinium_polyedra.AAC.1